MKNQFLLVIVLESYDRNGLMFRGHGSMSPTNMYININDISVVYPDAHDQFRSWIYLNNGVNLYVDGRYDAIITSANF